MGTSQYISLKDAALMTERSQQTIRRLIKTNKVRYRKYKTPQGFTYLVEKTSLVNHFNEEGNLEEAELVEEFDPAMMTSEEVDMEIDEPFEEPASRPHHQPMSSNGHAPYYSEAPVRAPMPPPVHATPVAPPPPPPAPALQPVLNELIRQHREDKGRLFELLETFQKRILILEEHIRQLEAPKAAPKKWYQFFRR